MPRKRPTRPLPDLDFDVLIESWTLALTSERKSRETLKSYLEGVRQYLTWCEERGTAPLERAGLSAWVAHLLDIGRAPSTAQSRQNAVRRFSRWLLDEDLIEADPFADLRGPRGDSKVLEPLTDDELRALLATCRVPKGTHPTVAMRHRRDEALIRFMVETGARAGEAVALGVADVDLAAGTAVIRRGKGGKGRVVPFGPATATAIDRYQRARATHRLAKSAPEMWLGDRGKTFTYDALHRALSTRAREAGIERFKPHLLRHTAAHRWLAAGGSDSGLMAVAGWSRPDMLLRYTRARATDRAVAESRTLNLGDL